MVCELLCKLIRKFHRKLWQWRRVSRRKKRRQTERRWIAMHVNVTIEKCKMQDKTAVLTTMKNTRNVLTTHSTNLLLICYLMSLQLVEFAGYYSVGRSQRFCMPDCRIAAQHVSETMTNCWINDMFATLVASCKPMQIHRHHTIRTRTV